MRAKSHIRLRRLGNPIRLCAHKVSGASHRVKAQHLPLCLPHPLHPWFLVPTTMSRKLTLQHGAKFAKTIKKLVKTIKKLSLQ